MTIAVLTTGGTIAMSHSEEADGAVPSLSGEEFSKSIDTGLPAHYFEEFCNVASSHLRFSDIEGLRDRVALLVDDERVSGVVVTHGTDTLEETALLLDLTVPGGKPVAVTGAMRTAGVPGYDGSRNISDAIRVVGSRDAGNLGCLVVMNEEIHAARSVTKMHSLALETFQSPGRGPLGRMVDNEVVLDRRVERRVIRASPLEERVYLIKLGIGSGPELFDAAVAAGARGIVLECFGGGRVPPWFFDSINTAQESGVAVAVASRCPIGRLTDRYGFEGSFRSVDKLNVLWAHGLNGQKARVQLSAMLGAFGGEELNREWQRVTYH